MGEERELEHWQKLSEVCLNISSTMFAIIFSIIFGLWSTAGKPSTSFWTGFLAIAITFVLEVSFCIWALYGSKKEMLPRVRRLAKLSVLGMFAMVVEMVIMLVYLQFI
jgi:hypothetical protein